MKRPKKSSTKNELVLDTPQKKEIKNNFFFPRVFPFFLKFLTCWKKIKQMTLLKKNDFYKQSTPTSFYSESTALRINKNNFFFRT